MKIHLRPFLIIFIYSLFILSACAAHKKPSGHSDVKADTRYQNIIVMVPDGCSMGIQTLARFYKRSALHLDRLNSGSVRTHSANSVVTDSAAAATAFATGHKTTDGFLGVGPRVDDLLTGFKPDALPYEPVPSILEGAKFIGKSTGIVVTAVVSHATPGAFAAHVSGRMMYDDIMEQMAYQDINVVFGGGISYLLPVGESYQSKDGKVWHGARRDSENLIHILEERGYRFISNRDELDRIADENVWGIFNDKDLVPDINRDEFNPLQPSLAEMTEKAIGILSKSKKGFFLVVEGSHVDYGGHDNDPAFMVTEFLAFDEAAGRAVDFAEKDGNTLVIIFPDHDTGGLSIGNNSILSRKYSSLSLEDLLSPIKNAEITIQGLLNLVYNDNQATIQEIQDIFRTKWNLTLDDNQADEIIKMKKNSYAVADYISRNFTILGWTSSGHTGTDVPLWIYPFQKSQSFTGNIDNTQIALDLASIMGFDLTLLKSKLFTEVGTVFPEFKLLNDKTGYVFETSGVRIPVNKDIIYKGDKVYRTGGITVYAPDINKIFIPAKAIEIIKARE